MGIFDILTLVGGLCLFLFGMNVMGTALEKSAGNSLKSLLGRLTGKKSAGIMTGAAVTAVVQSSSATTVMVIGFVNSGIMTLSQAINVIMGANIGTTVTSWILSLTGIESSNVLVRLLKPSSFTPVLALIGITLYMMSKNNRKKDTGLILLGFMTLMFGMETMTGAVSGLKDVPEFQNILLLFSNPLLGVIAGAVLTAIIQSSSASVGILQALAATGKVTFGSAVPIIMGQNIGTCVTAMISSVGTNKNAKRAAIVHLSFNIIGALVLLTLFSGVRALLDLKFVNDSINQVGIAIVHTAFNLLSTIMLLPAISLLEKLSFKIIPDSKASTDIVNELDERLFTTPAIAVERCRTITKKMAGISSQALKDSISVIFEYNSELAAKIRENEEVSDQYEDILGNYIVRLNSHPMTDKDSTETAKLLRVIGDLERISDHAVNLLESAEEIKEKGIEFTAEAKFELSKLTDAVQEIIDLSFTAFINNDIEAATIVQPLEEVIDDLKEQLRSGHILRMQKGACSMEAGFVWADLITNLERVADHCTNIANCIVEKSDFKYSHSHEEGGKITSGDFLRLYDIYSKKYSLK